MRILLLVATLFVAASMAAPANQLTGNVDDEPTTMARTEQFKNEATITLISRDGQAFNIPPSVAGFSLTIKNMIEDLGGYNDPIPLPNVDSKSLAYVIQFSKKHTSDASKEELKQWTHEFYAGLSQSELFDMILAANYLHIHPLLDGACKFVADLVKGKTPIEIRAMFNIDNDFTPEEEEEIKRESHWAFA